MSGNHFTVTASGNAQVFTAESMTVGTGGPYRFTAADFAALSPDRALAVVEDMDLDQAVGLLASVPPATAAAVVALMAHEEAVPLVARMHPDRVTPVLGLIGRAHAAPLTDAVRANADITTNAAQWRSTVGKPAGELEPAGPSPQGTTGYCRAYTHFTLYWTGTGTCATVPVAMADRYAESGGPAGELGFPVGVSESSGAGVIQRFEGGAFIAASLGTFRLGPRTARYHGVNGAVLGLPTTEESEIVLEGVTGRVQTFEGGRVLWADQLGPFRVPPELDRNVKWFPYGEARTVTSPYGTEGLQQDFSWDDDLVLAHSAVAGTRRVLGTIGTRFDNEGCAEGRLGFPRTNETALRGRRRRMQVFEGGRIYAVADNTVVVLRPVADALDTDPDVATALGVPLGEQQTIGGGPDLIQRFEGGVVTVVDGSPTAYVLPAAGSNA